MNENNYIRVKIDDTQCDLYSNFMPVSVLTLPSLNKIPDLYKNAFKKTFENILNKINLYSNNNIVNVAYKSALNNVMQDINYKIDWNQQPLANDIKKYLSDKIARITKYTLMITDKDESLSILKPIEPITMDIYNETIDSVVEDISLYYNNRRLKIDIC